MPKIFLAADLHFGHKNIIEYENRPFVDIKDMDEALIRNWNNKVNKNDKIFVAGDFSFYDKEETANIVRQLNGHKILIKGNHDNHSNQFYLDVGFAEVSKYPIIYNDWFVIQHEPPHYYNDRTPLFYIYGHVHGCEMYPTIAKQSACVSIERWEYAPVDLNTIIDMASGSSDIKQ